MSLPKLYIETTIPSYLTARRSRDLRLAADQEATLEWWEDRRDEYEVFVSPAVIAEVRVGDPEFAAKRLTLLDGIPELGTAKEVTELAARLLSDQIIPKIAAADALYLAYSAVHGLDFLLTWKLQTHTQSQAGAPDRGCLPSFGFHLPDHLHSC